MIFGGFAARLLAFAAAEGLDAGALAAALSGLGVLRGRLGDAEGAEAAFAELFALGGLAAAFLGALADRIGLHEVYVICSFLPVVGLVTWFLPKTHA